MPSEYCKFCGRWMEEYKDWNMGWHIGGCPIKLEDLLTIQTLNSLEQNAPMWVGRGTYILDDLNAVIVQNRESRMTVQR